MKKRLWIIVIIVLFAVLLTPIPSGTFRDGGTSSYTALTYKIVHWNRLTGDSTYEKTRMYWGENVFKSLDELWELEAPHVEKTFLAQIVELESGGSVLIRPLNGEAERQSADRIRVVLTGKNGTAAKVGDYLQITYTGGIMESYPAQINMVSYEFATDLRNIPYTDQWLDKEKAVRQDSPFVTDMVISYIYENCFMASNVVPLPYVIKINGHLSDEWCVGDQVYVTQENIWYEEETYRYEADLVSITASDFQVQEGVCYKPVIYLYPQKTAEVSVKLPLNGQLTCTYPTYTNGWHVTAQPDGTLTDSAGMTYNYLYWEGSVQAQWDISQGFCVPGNETAAFLETTLAQLGLNRKEANEFIIYWLPLMQDNPYNIISFQTQAYTDAAPLQISPCPDTLIRVFMTWQATDTYCQLLPQKLTAPEREGFTVVEWGGTEIK